MHTTDSVQQARSRVAKFVAEFRKIRGLDQSAIHCLHTGDDLRECELLLEDLAALISATEVDSERAPRAESAPQAAEGSNWKTTVDSMVDIYFDGVNNAPEHRCYVDGALHQVMEQAQSALAGAETAEVEPARLRTMIEGNAWHSMGDVMPILRAARAKEWEWFANDRCKYIGLRIDMRDFGCILSDRHGVRISPETFAYQHVRAAGLEAGLGT